MQTIDYAQVISNGWVEKGLHSVRGVGVAKKQGIESENQGTENRERPFSGPCSCFDCALAAGKSVQRTAESFAVSQVRKS
jgi:hypothetical protein